MINRFNYEIWFLDYVEGKLSVQDIRMLNTFLEQNPDLKEELDDFEIISLKKEEFVYKNKDILRKELESSDTELISEFEDLSLKRIEGIITSEELNSMDELMRLNPSFVKEYKLLELTKLTTDKSLKYKYKNHLKKNVGSGANNLIRFVTTIAAMSILIVFSALFFNKRENPIMVTKPDNSITVFNTKYSEGSTFQPSGNTESNSISSNDDNKLNNYQKKKTNSKFIQFSDDGNDILIKEENKESTTEGLQSELRRIEIADAIDVKPARNFNIETTNLETSSGLNAPTLSKAYFKPDLVQTSKQSDIALTPKELIIKNVKDKLNIKDRNYENIDPVKAIVAVVDKTGLGKVDYALNSSKKEISISIGGISFSRKWNSGE